MQRYTNNHLIMLDLDHTFLTDVDECAGPDHGCDHNCLNSKGSYYCSCFEGYELSSDGHMCNGKFTLTYHDKLRSI